MLETHMLKGGSLFLLILILVLSSCTKDRTVETLYGIELNEERGKVGLSYLRDGWISLPQTESGRIWWQAKSIDSAKIMQEAYYAAKVQLFFGDSLICETDEYVSSNVYQTRYGERHISLLYTYTFYPYDEFTTGWTYFLQTNSANPLYGYISKSEADSILISWKLKHPS